MSQFEANVQKAFEKLHNEINQRGLIVATELHDEITKRTPILTGRAKASWNIVMGESPSNYVYRDMTLLPPAAWLTRQQAEKVAKIKQALLNPYDFYTISNSLHYIVGLEFGASKYQAPMGMVRLAVIDAKRKMGVK